MKNLPNYSYIFLILRLNKQVKRAFSFVVL